MKKDKNRKKVKIRKNYNEMVKDNDVFSFSMIIIFRI